MRRCLGLRVENNAQERAFQRPPDETESRDEESVGGAWLFISGVATIDTCNISSSLRTSICYLSCSEFSRTVPVTIPYRA